MKPTGYTKCFEAIKEAILETPICCEPFTIYFDNKKLEQIKATYGIDLYSYCIKEVMNKVGFYDTVSR